MASRAVSVAARVRLGRADWVRGRSPLAVTATYLALPDGSTRAFAFADRLRPGRRGGGGRAARRRASAWS